MSKKFEGNGVVVEMTQEPGCIIKVKVNLDAKSTSTCHKKAIKAVNKRISIPGFRKGKAPDSSIVERFSSHIEQEFKENIVQEAFEQALQLSQIYPIRKESITRPKVVSSSLEEGSEVTFSFETTPELPVIDFSKIKLDAVEKKPIDETRIDEIIKEIKKSHASYEEQIDRTVQEGDFVDLTINAQFEDGQMRPVVEKRRFEVNNQMYHWLKNLVIGMKTGETKEGVMTPNPDASEQEKNEFKQMPVMVEVLGIYTILLPEFDDTLAEKLGAKTKEEVLEKIRHNLELQALDEQREKQVSNLEEELLKLYPIDLPSVIVLEEKKERIKNRLAGLKTMKLTDEQILARQKEIEDEINDEVMRAIRLYYLYEQIAKQGNLSVSKEELNALLADEMMKRPHLYQKDMDSETIRKRVNQLRAIAHQRKVESFILEEIAK